MNLLQAMSPIAVIVDEADAQLGNRSSSGDSGVGNRVFAQIAQFMGNTELRGKVIWFLLTSRPDLLPVDLKRQGRAEEHIALFYPETDEERLAMLRAMQKKTGTADRLRRSRAVLSRTFRRALSGADVEAVLIARPHEERARERFGPGYRGRSRKPRSKISSRRPIRPKSNCKTWPPFSNAPAGVYCRPNIGTWTAPSPHAAQKN